MAKPTFHPKIHHFFHQKQKFLNQNPPYPQKVCSSLPLTLSEIIFLSTTLKHFFGGPRPIYSNPQISTREGQQRAILQENDQCRKEHYYKRGITKDLIVGKRKRKIEARRDSYRRYGEKEMEFFVPVPCHHLAVLLLLSFFFVHLRVALPRCVVWVSFLTFLA